MIYLKTILVVLALLAGWLTVRAIARRFAARHPEFGALHEDGSGSCGCGNHKCGKKAQCK